MISASLIYPINPYLKSRGVDIRKVMRECGLSFNQLRDPLAVIPWGRVARLFEVAARECYDYLFGLRCGLSGSRPLNLLDYYMRTMDTAGEALSVRAKYARVAKTGHEVRFTRVNGLGRWEWSFLASDPCIQLSDYLAANHILHLQELLSDKVHPLFVRFAHLPLRPELEYARVLPVSYEFNSTLQVVEWPARVLEKPIPGADSNLALVLKPLLEEVLDRTPPRHDFVGRVKNAVRSSMAEGCVKSTAVASRLGCSTRTMQRRLLAANLTFREVLDATKKESADQLIANTKMPITEIAFCLGYSDASAFSRQYKIWFGMSPRLARAGEKRPPRFASKNSVRKIKLVQ